ncbi:MULTISPECIES: glycine betaine ABC transporter substrate-binding protein [unclassified Gordonia (in: high G+C Gram-positive bacteria)]|uniref:glycine betaine ABC transporter substrate-binding protein n=1 Tax=unclassified Gordonia (in: high G+C Gram-positive bacteria) TaxID=2657482 RepID=UPI001FFF9826|nr:MULTISPECIES: glycine betaine ABC transporter substrate-binding protein [unclassified Gordonia (in: high G+C Gram-positive bacteria)]UQE73676.1 glycine betaine ABC transporter substrate-binding protein [Gordonia sp. PP30]
MTRRARRAAPAIVALLTAALLAGCGLVSSSGTFHSAKLPDGDRPLAGAHLTVVSKSFTEQVLLGKITATYLAAAGAEITDLTGAPGSASGRQVMVNGDADVTWEYTGTAWQAYHGQTEAISDPHELWQRVHDLEEKQGLIWLPPAGFNNTYAFATSRRNAERLGVHTLSEVAKLPVHERTFCIDDEFFSRADGMRPMLEAYGIPFNTPDGVPQNNVTRMDSGVVYSATAAGKPCNFGMVYTTDGRIQNLGLVVMQDDRKFFLPYNGAAVVQEATLRKYPQLRGLLGEIAGRLTDEGLQQLNAKVDIDGQDPADVAYDWLIEQKLVVPD